MRSIWWISRQANWVYIHLKPEAGPKSPSVQWQKFLLSHVAQAKTADVSLLREKTKISVSKPGLGGPGLTGQAQHDLWPWEEEEERRLQQHPQLEQCHPEPVPVQLHRSHLIPPAPCSAPLVAEMMWGSSEGEALPSGVPSLL